MVADNPSFRTGPCLESRRVVSCRHRILACVLFLTSCGGCQESSPVTAVQEKAPPTLEIAPKGVSLVVGESLRFTATVGGTLEGSRDVRWLASGGFIDQTGLFHAGDEAGTYEVRAELETGLGVLRDVSAGPIVPRTEEDDDIETEIGVIFQDDFEDNHFRQWSGLAPAGDPRWDGMGDGGAHIGDGYITDERAHSGRFAWKALVDPNVESRRLAYKSSLERWKGMGALEFYISAWYFIPTDYPAVDTQLMQIKAAGSGPSHKPVGFRVRRGDKELYVRSGILDTILYRTGVKAPLGRWFNLTGRFVIADSGLVEMWLDGQKIASIRTDTKDNDHAYPGVGNYIDDIDYPVTCHIYVDDVKVTTSPP